MNTVDWYRNRCLIQEESIGTFSEPKIPVAVLLDPHDRHPPRLTLSIPPPGIHIYIIP